MVHLFAAGIADPDQPVTEGFGLVQWPREVKRQVVAIETAGADLDLVRGFGTRPLGHHIDHASGLILPVEHRGRPFKNFDALQGIGVDLWRAAQTPGRRQISAIEIKQGRGKAAAGDFIGDGVAVGVAIGAQARGVTQGLGQIAGALDLHLIRRHHVDGLRDLQNRCIGFSGRGRSGGNKTVNRSASVLGGTPRYCGCSKIQGARCRQRVNAQGTALGHVQTQTAACQGTLGGLLRGEHAPYRGRGFPLQQGRSYRQGQLAVTGNPAQCHTQRRRRQVKGTQGALFIGQRPGHRTQRAGNAQGNGQRQQAGSQRGVRHGASFLVAR